MNFSLHRKPGTKNYYVAFRVLIPDAPEGGPKRRLVFRTTGKATKAEAREAAERIVSAEAKAVAADTVTQREIAAIVADAAVKAEKGQLSVAEGTRLIARLVQIGKGGEVETVTLRQWSQRWLATKSEGIAKPGKAGATKSGFASNTGKRYAGIVADLLAFLPEKADASILLLNAGDLERWRDHLKKEGRTGSSVNLALKVCRTCLNAARNRGVILANPAEAVDFLPEAESVRVNFSPEDIRRIVEAAPSVDWRGAVLIAYFGGLSLADTVNLRWRQIDLTVGMLIYRRTKSKRDVKLPLHPELAAWLEEQPAPDDGEAYVLPSLAGGTSGGRSGLSSTFGRIVEAAGVTVEEVEAEGPKGRKRKALGFHSTRHGFVTAMADAGVAPDLRKALAGHASDAMSERYTHRAVATLKAAVDLIPGLPSLPKVEGPKGEEGKP